MRVSIWSSVMKPESRAVRLASSEKPMLVGEVRWAMRATGCSCTLSGGRWLSSGPTKASKKAQVRRATRRRNLRCVALSSLRGCGSGRSAHQTISGEKNHSSSKGAAAGSAHGRTSASSAAIAIATVGPAHSARRLSRSASSVPAAWPARMSAEAVHSSSRRPRTMRHIVRAIASSVATASVGRQARVCTSCIICSARGIRRLGDGDAVIQEIGARARPITWAANGTMPTMTMTRSVHMKGSGSRAQPSTASAISAAGTRLRRRLSNSFHFDSVDSGLRGAPGSACRRRRSQPISCQSPRTQRRRRAMSAA